MRGPMRVRLACENGGRAEQKAHRLYDQRQVPTGGSAPTMPRRTRNSSLLHRRAKQAEKYPPRLCQAIVAAAKKDNAALMVCLNQEDVDEVWAGDEGEGGIDPEELIDRAQDREAHQDQVSQMRAVDPETVEEDGEENGDEHVPCRVTRKEKGLIQRLHVNLGHPRKEDFYRALKMSRARAEILTYVKREFKCDHCTQHQEPKSARPATIPKGYAPNRVVGVDVVYFPGINPREQKPILNIIDWGTCYQMLEPVPDLLSDSIWSAFVRSWLRTFGMPEMIVMDQGREFTGAFAQRAAEYGGLIRTIGARAPWQNGRTERHGGLAKGTFIKAGNQVGRVG